MSSKLSLSVQYGVQSENIPSRYDFRRWVKSALVNLHPSALLTLRLVDDKEGLALNQQYRHKPYATNVLTFSFDEAWQDEAYPLIGDIVLCVSVITQEAEEQKKILSAHYAHLVIHGVLHLQGYDHLTDSEAQVMETLEIEILQKQGFANPYESL